MRGIIHCMKEILSYQSNRGVAKIEQGMTQMVEGVGLSVRDGIRNMVPMAVVGVGAGAMKAAFTDLEFGKNMKEMIMWWVKAGFVIGKYDAVLDYPESVSLKSHLLSFFTDVLLTNSTSQDKGKKAIAIMAANPVTIDGAGKVFEGLRNL